MTKPLTFSLAGAMAVAKARATALTFDSEC